MLHPTASSDSPSAIEAVSEVFADREDVDGLGLLPYSNGVHDSLDDQPRRRIYREYIANGELPAGCATEDGVGLHYIGTEMHEAVAMRDGAQAWWVEPSRSRGYHDEPIPSRRL